MIIILMVIQTCLFVFEACMATPKPSWSATTLITKTTSIFGGTSWDCFCLSGSRCLWPTYSSGGWLSFKTGIVVGIT